MTKKTETIISYKGFDSTMSCRGHKFEIGKTYIHKGEVKACNSGFHACEHPLDVFGYYPPATSRYAQVTQSGTLARHSGDTKVASAKITIDAELRLPEIIAAAIKYVFDRSKPEGETATGYSGAASATGYSGAASATGTRGAASATGDNGAASATGYSGRVMGAKGCALFLIYRDPSTGVIKHAWAGIAGQSGIKPLTWYSLSSEGRPVEV